LPENQLDEALRFAFQGYLLNYIDNIFPFFAHATFDALESLIRVKGAYSSAHRPRPLLLPSASNRCIAALHGETGEAG
jgi:hypothetical protein